MSRNQTLALALLAMTVLTCVVIAIAILIWPEESLKRYDTAWFRAVLMFTSGALLSLVSIELYNLWHDPTAIRMTRHCIRYVKGLGIAGAASPVGFWALQKFEGFGVTVTLQEIGMTSVLMALGSIAGVILLNQHYTQLQQAGSNVQ